MAGSQTLTLGAFSGGGAARWEGDLDDIRIYARRLSHSDVAALSDFTPVHYAYDALGPTTAPETTTFVMAGAQVVAEYNNGMVTRSYAYGRYVDEPIAFW
ncbi:MAG: hypothetical protein EA401_12145, partial [Planctomycetota bacterium]